MPAKSRGLAIHPYLSNFLISSRNTSRNLNLSIRSAIESCGVRDSLWWRKAYRNTCISQSGI
jgi:hypothetical protein